MNDRLKAKRRRVSSRSPGKMSSLRAGKLYEPEAVSSKNNKTPLAFGRRGDLRRGKQRASRPFARSGRDDHYKQCAVVLV